MIVRSEADRLKAIIASKFEVPSEISVKSIDFQPKGEIWTFESFSPDSFEPDNTFYAQTKTQNDEETIRVWAWPDDPELEELKVFFFEESSRTFIEKLEPNVTTAEIKLVNYRPAKRATLSIETEVSKYWIKVVNPKEAERVSQTQLALEQVTTKVPALLAKSQNGVLVYESANGVEVWKTESENTINKIFWALSDFLSEINQISTSGPSKLFASQWLDTYFELIGKNNRGLANALEPYLREIQAKILGLEHHRRFMNVHGDLHLGQLFWNHEDDSLQIIDLDNFGFNDIHRELGSFLSSLVLSKAMFDWELSGVWIEHLFKLANRLKLSKELLLLEGQASLITRFSMANNLEIEQAISALRKIRDF